MRAFHRGRRSAISSSWTASKLGLLAGDDSFNDEGLASWLAQPNAKALRSTGRPDAYGIATVRGALRAVEGSRIGPNYIQTRTIPE